MTGAPPPASRRLLVAVATYRRTELLPPLIAAMRDDAARSGLGVRLLVVDNNPDRDAGQTAAALGVDYAWQPIPGIPAARQAALDAAADDELLVMLDDDLVPEPGWLRGLLEPWRASGATAVMGYVRYVWPASTDPWISSGGFMRRTLHPTGTRLSDLATGNVLLDVAQLRALGIGFDVSIGLAGGSDLQLGRDILAAGGTIVASADSIARDDVEPARTTRAFVRRRSIAQGQARVRLLCRDSSRSRALAKRGGHLLGGVVRLPAFAIGEQWARVRRDVAASATYRRRLWFAQGRVLGAIGRIDPEYARTPTPSAASR